MQSMTMSTHYKNKYLFKPVELLKMEEDFGQLLVDEELFVLLGRHHHCLWQDSDVLQVHIH